MPSGEEETIVRNGTIQHWLRYFVVFFGKKPEPVPGVEYPLLIGGFRIRGQWLVALALLLGVAIGGLLF